MTKKQLQEEIKRLEAKIKEDPLCHRHVYPEICMAKYKIEQIEEKAAKKEKEKKNAD